MVDQAGANDSQGQAQAAAPSAVPSAATSPVQAAPVTCPTCGTRSDLSAGTRCLTCSTDLGHPAIAMLAEADAAIAQCQQAYDELSGRWTQWNQHRAALLRQLDASRLAPPPLMPVAKPHASGQRYAALPVGAQQSPTPGVGRTKPASSRPPQERTPAPTVNRRTPRRLTAPVLLGIAGAALLITAVVIFVAVTWTTFNPAAQGLLILAVAAALGYCARWLSRHELEVSGGAVGVVAASFAGVSVFAFDRGTGVLGAYASAGALVVTGAVGYALSRMAVKWVHPFAALAVVGAGVAATIAFAGEGSSAPIVWVPVVATASGLLMSATHPLWRGPIAPRIVRFGAVCWVTAAGLFAAAVAIPELGYIADQGFGGNTLGVSLGLALPVVALVLWRVPWPRVVAAPLGLVAPLSIAMLVGLTVTQWWVPLTAGVLAVAALVWWAGSWPRANRVPLLFGLLPAAAAFALAAVLGVGSSVVYVGVMFLGGAGLWVGPLVGLVIISLGAIPLAFRGWAVSLSLRGAVETVGSTVVVGGLLALAVSASSAWWPSHRGELGMLLVAAAAGAAASRWIWRPASARSVATLSAVAIVTVAGLLGAEEMAFRAPFDALWPAVGAIAIPVIGLLFAARWWPAHTVGSLTLLLTAASAALVPAAGISEALIIVVPLAATAGVAWALSLAPRTWRAPGWIGLAPALAIGALIVTAYIFGSLGGALAYGPNASFAGGFGWAALSVVLFAVAVAALWRGDAQDQLARVSQDVGAASALGAMVICSAWARASADTEWIASVFTLGAGLVAATSAVVWYTSRARRIIRMGAGVWLALQTLVALSLMSFSGAPLSQSVVPAALGVVLLAAVAWRWLPITYGPAVFALAVFVPALVLVAGGSIGAIGFAAVGVVAALLWVTRFVEQRVGKATAQPMLVGLLVPGIGVVIAASTTGGAVLLTYVSTIVREGGGEPRWWGLGIALAASAGALAWKPVRRAWTWVALATVFVAGGAISPLVGAASSIALAVALVALVVTDKFGRATSGGATSSRGVRWCALAASIVAVGWGAGADWSVALTAAMAAAVAWWIVATAAHGRLGHALVDDLRATTDVDSPAATTEPVFSNGDVGLTLAVMLGALSAGFSAAALGAQVGLATVVATAVAVASILFSRLRSYESDPRVGVALLALATVVPAPFAGSVEVAGVAVLVAAVGWWALRLLGWKPGTWVALAVTSAGVALVLAGASIGTVEAYFATPAACALAIGAWELRTNAAVRTLPAIGPGLALALAPSYLAMIAQPAVTGRVLILVSATLVLAVVGVLARWFAPVLAACITAVVIALTQVLVTDNAGIRWVAFAVVGALLLVVAATFEKLKKLR